MILKHILFLLLFSITSIQAQKLSYQDGTISYEGESVETINVILDPKPDLLENKFEKWMSKNYKVNLKDKTLLFFDKEFMSAKGIVIPEISAKKIDLHVKVDQTRNDYTTLHVFSSLGYNSWITRDDYPYEYAVLNNIVREFISEYLPEYYYEELDEAKELLADLSETREDMSETFEDNLKEIEDLRKENAELMLKLKNNHQRIIKAESDVKIKKRDYKEIKKRIRKNE